MNRQRAVRLRGIAISSAVAASVSDDGRSGRRTESCCGRVRLGKLFDRKYEFVIRPKHVGRQRDRHFRRRLVEFIESQASENPVIERHREKRTAAIEFR